MANKTKAVLIIVAGLIFVAVGIFAGYLLIQRSRGEEQPIIAEEETVETTVVILTRDLSLGDRISEGDVILSNVPVEIAPRNVLSSLDDAIGKIVKTDLIQGEMVLSQNLADPTNNNKDLSFILSEDHVLLAFPASDLMSVHSMVQRGDIVDIFATFEEEVKVVGETNTATGEAEEPQTRTFTLDSLQKVGVTAMVLEVIEEEGNTNTNPLQGQQEGTQPTPEPRVRILSYLLALDPQDALILKHLKDTGAIFDIVLRAPTSTVEFELTSVTEEYIIEYYGLEILP